METEKRQIHLARKLTVPEALAADGKTVKTPERVVELPGMSNRVVRYRTLDVLEINAIDEEVAKLAGPEATGRQLRNLALMHYLYAMVYQVSAPTDDPLSVKKGDWIATEAALFQVGGSATSWGKLFSPKDTAVLQSEYTKWHEMTVLQVDMLSGKAIPVATDD